MTERARPRIVSRRALFTGRRTPYTTRGIARKRCVRCGARAVSQWSTCANGNRWLPLCRECDVAVNELVLRYLNVPNWPALIKAYERRVARDFPNMGD